MCGFAYYNMTTTNVVPQEEDYSHTKRHYDDFYCFCLDFYLSLFAVMYILGFNMIYQNIQDITLFFANMQLKYITYIQYSKNVFDIQASIFVLVRYILTNAF